MSCCVVSCRVVSCRVMLCHVRLEGVMLSTERTPNDVIRKPRVGLCGVLLCCVGSARSCFVVSCHPRLPGHAPRLSTILASNSVV